MPRVHPTQLEQVESSAPWRPAFPNPADFRFNYWKLLDDAKTGENGIGNAPSGPTPKVAVVGAGVAGLVTARELYRAGYAVDIYEASDRIGGRHYTQPLPGQDTAAELGAMRFPFFGGTATGTNNSLMDYFMSTEAPGLMSNFPNPGKAPGGTGVWIDDGYGPNDQYYPNQRLIPWWPGVNNGNPDNEQLENISAKVDNYVDLWQYAVKNDYVEDDWEQTWQKIAQWYEQMTYSDLVFANAVTPAEYTSNNDGWLGGYGMSEDESQLAYTIGAGDGSWGAFYEIGALWFLRCTMFGFSSNLQTIEGMNDAASLPNYNDTTLNDSGGNRLPAPLYQGIESIDEWLLYETPPGMAESMYDASSVGLYTRRTVSGLTKQGVGSGTTIELGWVPTGSTPGTTPTTAAYDYVVVSPEIWASQLSMELEGFNPFNDVPSAVTTARDTQHQITSKKVFYALKSPYWNDNPDANAIPQILVTDTFVQDAYGVHWGSSSTGGALLASYTWEDDATKLTPIDDNDLAKMCLDKLDEITTAADLGKISAWVDNSVPPIVWRWSQAVGYSGCAKLYRQRNWTSNMALLAYNQEYSAESHMYFAGESYDVTGGWTEPAMRTAIDAVIHIINNSGGTFNNEFTFNDYPTYDNLVPPESWERYRGGPS